MSVRGKTPGPGLSSSKEQPMLLHLSDACAEAAGGATDSSTETVTSMLLDAFRATLRRSPEPRHPPSPSGSPPHIDSQTPDEELARTACEGDPRAAIAIWRRYGVQVRSKLLRWIGAHDLDDHVQEVFSRLFVQLPRLRQRSALRSFLIGITLRVACTELRRRRRGRLHLTATGELPELVGHRGDDGAARQALTRFEAILDKLAPRTRRVFVLRYVEKMELVDVATAMDISLATAKRHLARASMRVFAMAEREPSLVDYLPDMSPRGLPTHASVLS
ncbi:MAG: RNA polymerase sigma factor [Myxococcota bacterium]|nr:RNA polymerase sigma factor [Myxococcota bacterium]